MGITSAKTAAYECATPWPGSEIETNRSEYIEQKKKGSTCEGLASPAYELCSCTNASTYRAMISVSMFTESPARLSSMLVFSSVYCTSETAKV